MPLRNAREASASFLALAVVSIAALASGCDEGASTEVSCPEYVTSCPTGCRAYEALVIDKARNCLRREPMLCLRVDPGAISSGTFGCAKRIVDGELFWRFLFGYALGPDYWTACSAAESHLISNMHACPELLD